MGGPAREEPDGKRYWYKNGLKHRDGDLPAVIFANGHRRWFADGVDHRDPKKHRSTFVAAWRPYTRFTAKRSTGSHRPIIIGADGECVWQEIGSVHH